VKIYQARLDKETHPDNFIKEMKVSLWKVVNFDRVTMDYYVNDIYTELLKQLTIEIKSLDLNSDYPTNGSYCDLLNTLKESKINLRY